MENKKAEQANTMPLKVTNTKSMAVTTGDTLTTWCQQYTIPCY